jgi:hypothetical protein
MAEPTLNLATPLQTYSNIVQITTATTDENVLANRASSGKKVRIDFLALNNIDGSAAVTARVQVRDEDGTGMNSNTGRDEALIGADVVAGTVIGNLCPLDMSIAAGGGQILIDDRNKYELHEDQALTIQASAANDLDVVMRWTVIG